ncbi:MAG: Ig-like domain-containing protein [Lachnospiraceae bacterium]|nr:Ig-like domain-containing protein [Lachnospiraceae bacterium]
MKALMKKILSVTLAIALAVLGAFSYVPLHALHQKMSEVKAAPAAYYSPEISSFVVKPDSSTIDIGKNTTVNATLSPSFNFTGNISFRSDNESVAVVSSPSMGTSGTTASCTVTGIGQGTVTIFASATDKVGEKVGYCTITVVNPVVYVTDIALGSSSLTVEKGKTGSVTATVNPSTAAASDRTVTWSSNDTSVATVDSNGVVTGIKKGTTTIKATSVGKKADGSSATNSYTVTVTDDTSKKPSISISKTRVSVGTSSNSNDDEWNESVEVSLSNTSEFFTKDIQFKTTNDEYFDYEKKKSNSSDTTTKIRIKGTNKTTSQKKGYLTAYIKYNGEEIKTDELEITIGYKDSSSSSSSSSSSTTTTTSTSGSKITGNARDGAVNASALKNANSGKSIQPNSAAQKNGFNTVSAVADALANATNRTKLLTTAVEVGSLRMGVYSSNPAAVNGKLTTSQTDALGAILSQQEMFDVVTGNAAAAATLTLTALDSASVDAGAKTAIEGAKKANENVYYFGSDMILTISYTNGSSNSYGITQFGSPLSISYDIPTSIRGNSNYRIIRTHAAVAGGALTAASLDDQDKVDTTVTVSTDKMCVMAFAYSGNATGGGTSSSAAAGSTPASSSGSSSGSGSKSGAASSASEEKSSSTAPGMHDLLDAVSDGMANADVPALMGTIAIENLIIIIEGIIFLTGRRRRATFEYVERKPAKAPEKPKKVSPRAVIHV